MTEEQLYVYAPSYRDNPHVKIVPNEVAEGYLARIDQELNRWTGPPINPNGVRLLNFTWLVVSIRNSRTGYVSLHVHFRHERTGRITDSDMAVGLRSPIVAVVELSNLASPS